MIKRILNNWRTTILGLLILALCFVLVWFEKATLTEVSLFITGGFALLFMKDPKKQNENP